MADLNFRSTVVASGSLWCDVAAKIYETGTDVGSNTSSVFYTVTGQQRTDYGFTGSNRNNAGTIVVSINGADVCSFTIGLKNSADRQSRNGTVSVPHNADGTKACSIRLRLDRGGGNFSGDTWTYNSNSASGSLTLSTIPRASQPSLSTGSATLGNTITINTNRASGSFTHYLWWSCGNSGWKDIGSADASKSWQVPNDIANYITSSTSGTVTVICRTYNGNTRIGSDKTTSFTAYVPDWMVPSMSDPSVSRVDNGVPSSWGVYVKGYSKVSIAIKNASGTYGSTIKSYSIVGPGLSTTSSSGTSSVLTGSGKNTYTVKTTDSRGRSASKTVSIDVQDYFKPSITLSGQRCKSDGTVDSSGTYLKVIVNWNIASVASKNSISSKSASCNSVSNTSFEKGTSFVLGANCAVNSSYTLTASIKDALDNSASANVSIPTAYRIMNVKANKKGVAFGKFAESNDFFEVGMKAMFDSVLSADYIKMKRHRIPQNADLNAEEYCQNKTFYSVSNNETATFKNCPTSNAFTLYNFFPTTSEFDFRTPFNSIWQNEVRMIVTIEMKIYLQTVQSDGNAKVSYSGWREILTSSTLYEYGVNYGTNKVATCNGKMVIWPSKSSNANSYNEGLRIIPSGNGWGELYFSADNTTEGNNGGWLIGRRGASGSITGNVGDLSIECGNSNGSGLTLYKDGSTPRWINVPFVLTSGATMDGLLKGARYKEPFVEGNNVYRLMRVTTSKTYLELRTDNGSWGIDMWASDESLKKNIKDTEIRYALEKISQLHHVQFNWKENDGHTELGYVADDVEKVLPCLVYHVTQYDENNNPNGFRRQIDYTTLIPLITMGIQELIEERDLLWSFDEESANCIISMRKEIENLKESVSLLNEEVQMLKAQLKKGAENNDSTENA